MKCELCSLSRKSNCDLLFHYYAHYLLYHYQKTESGSCPDKSFHALARGNDDFLGKLFQTTNKVVRVWKRYKISESSMRFTLMARRRWLVYSKTAFYIFLRCVPTYRRNSDFCRDIKSPSLDKGWPDEKFQNDFKKICRDQKPLGPIWLFLDKCGKNLETLFDEIRFRCTIDIRREIFSIVNGTRDKVQRVSKNLKLSITNQGCLPMNRFDSKSLIFDQSLWFIQAMIHR